MFSTFYTNYITLESERRQALPFQYEFRRTPQLKSIERYVLR